MNCELNLVPLSCDRTGVGFTASPLSSDSNQLRLLKGHAKHFPTLEGRQYFYVKIQGCNGCCEVAKVIRIEEDVLVLDRTISSKCECVQSNATVSYDWDNIHVVQDIANSIGINVLSPLKYDACTRTLSVDCKELFAADCGGCGCGEGAVAVEGATQPVAGGLRGEKGEKGEAGIGIAELKITPTGQLLYILTNGTSRSAGTLPQAKGQPGPAGPKGDRGEKGDTGADGVKVVGATFAGTTITFQNSDHTEFSVDVARLKGEQGEQGEPGEQGPKGEQGDPGQTYQYVEVGNDAYIFGVPNQQVTMTSPAMAGVTFGPYTTGADGFVKIAKPPLSGGSLLQIKSGTKLVGIGRAG